MPFTDEDKIVIKHYRVEKGYTSKLLNEFPDRDWTKGGLDYLLAKIDATGSAKRRAGSGHPRSVRIPENIEVVRTLSASQEEDGEGTHDSPREIENLTGISRSSGCD